MATNKFAKLTFILLIFFSYTYTYSQEMDGPPISKRGECYEKALFLPHEIIYKDWEFPIYIGDHPEEVNLEIQEVWVLKGTHKVLVASNGKKCIAKEENVCYNWAQIDFQIPTKVKILVAVENEEPFDENIIFLKYKSRQLLEEFAFKKWVEVICEKQLTKRIKRKISDFLFDKGYLKTKTYTKFTENFFQVLSKFQEDNNLPIGVLDLKTLQFMQIKVD